MIELSTKHLNQYKESPDEFDKNKFLENFLKFTEKKNLCQSLFLRKLQASDL